MIRRARAEDLDQIRDLQVERNGAECGPMVQALADDASHGIGCFTVAEDDGRVVSSLCLMRETMVIEGVDVPVGRPEFVATAAGYEHRGLVRAQMDLVHEWSAARGDLLQLITGIPYFYRRFGYEYALPTPRVRLLNPGVEMELPEGWLVRRATGGDVHRVMELSASDRAGVPVRVARPEEWWRWWLTGGVEPHYHVAEKDGFVHGGAFIGGGPPGLGDQVAAVKETVADDEDAVRALLAWAGAQRPDRPVAIEERAGVSRWAEGVSHRHPRRYGIYVRVPDPVTLIDRLRPVLSARLRRSHRSGASGSLLVSMYASSLEIHYQDGTVTSVVPGGPQQDPIGHGGIGVPPDLVATLVLGRYGAEGLAEIHPDVRLGPYVDLAEVLFPQLASDLALSL